MMLPCAKVYELLSVGRNKPISIEQLQLSGLDEMTIRKSISFLRFLGVPVFDVGGRFYLAESYADYEEYEKRNPLMFKSIMRFRHIMKYGHRDRFLGE